MYTISGHHRSLAWWNEESIVMPEVSFATPESKFFCQHIHIFHAFNIMFISFMSFGSFSKNYTISIEGTVDPGYDVWTLKDNFTTVQSWWISYLGPFFCIPTTSNVEHVADVSPSFFGDVLTLFLKTALVNKHLRGYMFNWHIWICKHPYTPRNAPDLWVDSLIPWDRLVCPFMARKASTQMQ